MENSAGVGPTYENDSKEYAEFCMNCGLFLADGLQIWRNALRAAGVSEQVIEVKLASATQFIRQKGHLG